MTVASLAAPVILVLVYVGVAIGRIPGPRRDRAGIAFPRRLSALVAALSNIVSNVPAVLALRPFISPLADPHRAWLAVAMSSTFASIFTPIGSVANLIVAEQARAAGTPIGFLAYFKVDLPPTLVTLAFGTAWLGRT